MIQEISYNMRNIFDLADIEKACFGKDAWSISNLRGEFENGFSYFFGEVVDGVIVGYACVRVMYEEGQVCNIAVLPDYRRQGIATNLLTRVKDFCKEKGCERCELEVNTANTPAVELYKKCQFEVAGTRVNFYRKSRYSTRDAYTMVAKL